MLRPSIPTNFALVVVLASLTGLGAPPSLSAGEAKLAPNGRPYSVLFIAIDDLNDWIGPLGGHPQVKTPHLDRLAAQSVTFTNAHCQAPICNPSRLSLLVGKLPSSTGVYYLSPGVRAWEATKRAVTLPQHFARNGYASWGVGKIFHGGDRREFGEYGGTFGAFGPRPPKPLVAGHTHPLWDWGVFPDRDEDMPDAKIAQWAAAKLKSADGPFFLGCGFYRPHVPMYAPKKWFDLYPIESVELPDHLEDDLADVPEYGQDLSWSAVAPRHRWIVEHDEWRHAVQSYLACVSFVDAQVGVVLDALDASGQRDNTIVVVWSDHGFHLGTKERWGKRSLWEASTKVVLMISAPGFSAGTRCSRPVGLIDLYPTLVELCGLPPVTGLEGNSLAPLLRDPSVAWPYAALTTFGQHNHSIRTDDWRYIVYADGSEELYDHRSDRNEFKNRVGDPELASIVEAHRRFLPQINHPMAKGSSHADARPGSRAEIAPDAERRKRREEERKRRLAEEAAKKAAEAKLEAEKRTTPNAEKS